MSEHNTDNRSDALGQVADYLGVMLADPAVLRGQQVRGGGPVAEFELRLSEITRFAHCLATSNATMALLVAAIVADLPGKTVIADRRAWCGSLGVLEFAGVHLQMVDSLDELQLKGVAAVLATDVKERRHNAAQLRSHCDEHDCLYLEDTGWLPGLNAPAEAYSVADIQVISFGPGKALNLGEGGALLVRERHLYERAITLSQHPERLDFEEISQPGIFPAINARIHPVAAVLGNALLKPLPGSKIKPSC